MACRLLPSHEQTVSANCHGHCFLRANRGQEPKRKSKPIVVIRIHRQILLQSKQAMSKSILNNQIGMIASYALLNVNHNRIILK
jgi:hypothetical protein